MKKLISNMKVFHLIMLCLAGLLIIAALPYKTEYSNIYINVQTTIEEADGYTTNTTTSSSQTFLFELFEKNKASGFVDNDNNNFKNDFNLYKSQVYEFENQLNVVNDLILWFGIVALIGVAVLYIFANNNRKIYYKSNVIASAIFTITVSVFGIIVLVKNIGVMSDFSANSNLYNIVSVMQNNKYNITAFNNATRETGASIEYLYSNFDSSIGTFIAYDLIIILVLAYTMFLFVLSVVKYNATSERRKELEKVVAVND